LCRCGRGSGSGRGWRPWRLSGEPATTSGEVSERKPAQKQDEAKAESRCFHGVRKELQCNPPAFLTALAPASHALNRSLEKQGPGNGSAPRVRRFSICLCGPQGRGALPDGRGNVTIRRHVIPVTAPRPSESEKESVGRAFSRRLPGTKTRPLPARVRKRTAGKIARPTINAESQSKWHCALSVPCRHSVARSDSCRHDSAARANEKSGQFPPLQARWRYRTNSRGSKRPSSKAGRTPGRVRCATHGWFHFSSKRRRLASKMRL